MSTSSDPGTDQAQQAMDSENLSVQVKGSSFAISLLVGLVAMVIITVGWVYFTKEIHGEIGYRNDWEVSRMLAWAVGALMGATIYFAAGRRRSRSLQVVASGCTLGSIALFKGFFLYGLIGSAGYIWFSWRDVTGPLDIPIIFLAFITAWTILKPSQFNSSQGPGGENCSC